MFTLRDTLAASLLGVQFPSNDSSSNSLNGAKKPKKKPHKKKPKKKKAEVQAQEGGDNGDSESVSSDAAENDDDEDVIANFGAALAASTTASKKAVLMAQQYESTQIEDQIHQMIRLLAEEFCLDKSVVSETVNRMFESGLQYDNREAVIKHLPIKAKLTRSIDVKDESGLPFTSAASSPRPISPVTQNAPQSRTATRSTRTFSASASDGVSAGMIATVDADAAAALAKLMPSSTSRPSVATPAAAAPSQPIGHTNTGGKAKHGKEIGSVVSSQPTQQAPIGPKSSVQVQVTPAEPALNSMKEKLDYVAAYSRTNLYDSLAALCSWASVSLPATGDGSVMLTAEQEKQQKMDAFFQSQALEILLTTLFSDDSQQLASRAEVKGAFQALLQHVVLRHGDSAGAGSVQHITDTLAQVVSQICTLRSAQVVPAFSDNSARGYQMLAQQVAACVKRLYSQLTFPVSTASVAVEAPGAINGATEEGNDELFGKLEAIDTQLRALEKTSAKKGTTTSEAVHEKVQNMFLSREIHCDKLQLCLESVKKVATQTSMTANSAHAVTKPQVPTAAANAAELTKSVAESSASIERILLNECNLLAPSPSDMAHPAAATSSAASIQSKHQQSHHINSHFDRLCYERDAKLSSLSNELSANSMRTQELSAHKQRLLEQVALCDQELGNLNVRSNALSSELSNATFYYQQQLDQLVQTGNSVRKSLQAHDQVNSLVTAVRNFENKFAEALLHEHSAHMAAANSHTPQGSLSPGGRNTTILTSSSFGAQKNAAAATPASASASACGVAAGESEEERRARLDERALLLGNTLRSYVAAEAQCIQFLSERVVAAETKLLTLRKELLAYAALSMKGSVVQQAEASVQQLETEVAEDRQAVQQLQQNVADTLAHVKALQNSLNPSIPARNGKYVPPSMKGATSSSAPVLAAVKLDMPSAELALIVQHCTCAKVTPATGILAHAGKVVVPAVPAPSPAATPAPAPAHPVITSSTAATAASSMTTTPSATDAPTAPRNVKPAREPRESARDSKTTSTSRAEREKGGDSKRGAGNSNGNNGKGGRGKAETKSEVDTSSAIQLLEKSCLQKPTAGGLPAKSAAPVKVDRPVPKVEASAPVPSVWKIPAASGSGGVQESKASEGVKSLKEIQEEQRSEKTRLAHQKAQKKTEDLASATALLSPAPTPNPASASASTPVPTEVDASNNDEAASLNNAADALTPPEADDLPTAAKASLSVVVATTATAADTVEVEVEVETSPVASQDTRAEEDSCCITAEAPSFSDSAPAVAAVESEVPSEVAEAHAEKVASPTPKKKKKAEKTEKGLLTPKQEPSTQEKNKSAKATKVPKTPKFPPVDSDNAVPTAAATMSTDDAPTESAVATMVASPATKKAVKSTTKTAKGKTEPTPSRDAPTGQVEKGAEIARAGDATVSETVISDNTPVKSTKKSKNGKDTNGESAAAKKTPAKANPVISKSAEQGSDSTLDATPVRRVETADSDSKAKSNARGDLHIDTISAAVAVCTPQGGVGRNLVSPLVEFHSTYPSMEDEHATSAGAGRRDSGDDYGDDCDGDGSQLSQEQHRHNHLSSASRAHDINPMQQLSPLVEHHSIYPDLLLGEVEEQEEGVEGGGGVGGTEDTSSNVQQSTGEITPLGGGVGATSGAGSGSTKMHDINPMARASPGRGIIRIKLDMSQGEDSVLSPAAPQNGSPGDGEVVELAE